MRDLVFLKKKLETKKVTLIAVSKTKPVNEILQVYNTGQRDFGENKVQELLQKKDVLPQDIRWHLIGHLQTNKVKYILPFITLIQSVDSKKLLIEINKQAQIINRTIDVLLEVYIAKEETKFGFLPEEILNLINQKDFDEMQNIQVRGLMAIASNIEDHDQIKNEFAIAAGLFEQLKKISTNQPRLAGFNILSMGMSGDYEIAIEAGSNMIRIGSMIFGARNY